MKLGSFTGVSHSSCNICVVFLSLYFVYIDHTGDPETRFHVLYTSIQLSYGCDRLYLYLLLNTNYTVAMYSLL